MLEVYNINIKSSVLSFVDLFSTRDSQLYIQLGNILVKFHSNYC